MDEWSEKTPAKFVEIKHEPERVFVIGDVHGCVDELLILLNALTVEEALSTSDQVVFLGDYIDRGPASSSVIELLLEFRSRFPATICLKGNHEDMLLDYLGEAGRMGEAFIQNGGDQTLRSYGCQFPLDPQSAREVIPEQHLNFFSSLEGYLLTPSHVIVHAGLSPIRSLMDQHEEDIFWIRNEFIKNIHYFEKTIIFGHTPYYDLFVHPPYKIGVDTGLVYGNMLSCLELKNASIMQVRHGQAKVVRSKLKLTEQHPRRVLG